VWIVLCSGADDGVDWIVEGLAEFYSLAILHRSGTISDRRYAAAIRKQADWGPSVNKLCGSISSGAITLGDFTAIVRQLAGSDPEAMNASNLPGCEI